MLPPAELSWSGKTTNIPALTIVTSVLNGLPYVSDMLASIPVRSDVEHLVIDAGSTDGTVEFLEGQKGLRLVRRPSLPLYDAWNLALAEMRGAAVWFVNADDLVAPGAVKAVLKGLSKYTAAEVIQGRSEAFKNCESRDGPSTPYPAPGEILHLLDVIFGAPVINGRIFRRSLMERAGPFDTRYQFAADREWLLRLATAPSSPVCRDLGVLLYRYRIHEGSMTLAQTPARRLAIADEHRQVAARASRQLKMRSNGDQYTMRMLQAWSAREAVAGLWSALRACRLWAITRLSFVIGIQPALAVRLARARKWQRAYLRRARAVSPKC